MPNQSYFASQNLPSFSDTYHSHTPRATHSFKPCMEPGMCPAQCAGLHHLPGQTIPWPVSTSVSTGPLLLMLYPVDAHQPGFMEQSSPHSSYADTSVPGPGKRSLQLTEPSSNSLPTIGPLMLSAFISYFLQNTYSILRDLAYSSVTSEGYKLHEKKRSYFVF